MMHGQADIKWKPSFPCDGWTDITKPVVALHSFAKAPRKSTRNAQGAKFATSKNF